MMGFTVTGSESISISKHLQLAGSEMKMQDVEMATTAVVSMMEHWESVSTAAMTTMDVLLADQVIHLGIGAMRLETPSIHRVTQGLGLCWVAEKSGDIR